MNADLHVKYELLRTWLRERGRVAVAFSGGVDSTLLASVAHEALGQDMCALTARHVALPRVERIRAEVFCRSLGIPQVVVDFDVMAVPGFADNPADRCYHCKRALFAAMREEAAARGLAHLVDGSNLDDTDDYRPGMRALGELGVESPLLACGLTKDDVRALSHELGLPTWDMPSAACLASRVPYGERIEVAKLARIEAAEDFLHERGLRQLRVRCHGGRGELARIEVDPDELAGLATPAARDEIVARLRELGFRYVTLDLTGFRSGSLNEVLS